MSEFFLPSLRPICFNADAGVKEGRARSDEADLPRFSLLSSPHLRLRSSYILSHPLPRALLADHPSRFSLLQYPTGKETGDFIALDLGGTNLRVCFVTLQGSGKFEITQTKYRLTEEQKQQDGADL